MPSNNVVIADFVEHVIESELPDDVADMARRTLLDWFAVSIAAMTEPEAGAVSKYVAGWGSSGSAVSLFGHDGAAAPVALVNGTLAHLLDFDDVHYDSAFHASAPTWAATLALGMARGIGEKRILRAFVAGYEVGAAFGIQGTGLALARRGWHPTAILGHLSSVVAASALIGLDRAKLGGALGTAATQAGGLVAAGGTAAKPLQVGKAAMAGVIAAEMAEQDVNGAGALVDVEGLNLFRALIGCAVPLGGLGERWHILDNSFKPYASCGFTHAAIEAAQILACSIVEGEIVLIRIHGNSLALQIAGHMNPQVGSEARFSLPYAVALGLLGYAPTPVTLGGGLLRQQDVAAMLDCTEIVVDPNLERWSSRVELLLHDGRRLSETVLTPRGMSRRPLTMQALEAKFDEVARERFGQRASAMLTAFQGFGVGGGGELGVIRDALRRPFPVAVASAAGLTDARSGERA